MKLFQRLLTPCEKTPTCQTAGPLPAVAADETLLEPTTFPSMRNSAFPP